MKFSSDFAAELQAALTEMCKSEELVLAVYPNKSPILNSPGCNFQWNVKSSLPPVAFGLITLFCPSSLGELTCSRSNSAAKYRKEDFLHYKKTFFILQGLQWGVGKSFAVDLLGDLEEITVLMSPSLSDFLLYSGFKVFRAGTNFCCVLHSLTTQCARLIQKPCRPTGRLGNISFFMTCNTAVNDQLQCRGHELDPSCCCKVGFSKRVQRSKMHMLEQLPTSQRKDMITLRLFRSFEENAIKQARKSRVWPFLKNRPQKPIDEAFCSLCSQCALKKRV